MSTNRGVLIVFVSLFVPWLGSQTVTVPEIAQDGVANAAHFQPSCAVNGGVAPGSLAAVFGRGFGTDAGGVSVRIGEREVTPLYVTDGQLAVVIPESAQQGDTPVTVTRQGRSSAPATVRVRGGSFGIFTINQRGGGPAAVQNAVAPGIVELNTPARPLRPGQLGVIWGTGLGGSSNVRVWVGDRAANVIYQGKSGCCAGVDQIIFETPAGIEGCQVPLMVEVNGSPGNFASVAIASGSGPCAPQLRPPPVRSGDPNFGLGTIIFLDGFGSVLLPTAGDDYVRLGFFKRGAVEGDVEAPLAAFEPNAEMPAGTCSVRIGTDFPPQPSQPRQAAMDAGPELRLTPVSGSGASFRLLQNAINAGNYEDPQRVVAPAARYRVDNGPGGRDIGPFVLEADLFTLRLTNPPDRIRRDRDLELTWDYSGPPGHLATLFGSSRGACGRELTSFTCTVRADARRFVIPPRVLALLPPSTSIFGIPNGALNISSTTPGGMRRFPARGLDLGLFLQIGIHAIRPFYQ